MKCAYCSDTAWPGKAKKFGWHVFCDSLCRDNFIRAHCLNDFLDDYIEEDRVEYEAWRKENGEEADTRQCRIDFCDSDDFDGFTKYVLGA